jgi:hypothetical protein
MKALQVTAHGAPSDVLRVCEVTRPESGPGEVRVDVLATAAAVRAARASGSVVAGYRLSFLTSTGCALLTAVFVAVQRRSGVCQELARQQAAGESPGSGAACMKVGDQ